MDSDIGAQEDEKHPQRCHWRGETNRPVLAEKHSRSEKLPAVP
jgi:hypothetical protein